MVRTCSWQWATTPWWVPPLRSLLPLQRARSKETIVIRNFLAQIEAPDSNRNRVLFVFAHVLPTLFYKVGKTIRNIGLLVSFGDADACHGIACGGIVIGAGDIVTDCVVVGDGIEKV